MYSLGVAAGTGACALHGHGTGGGERGQCRCNGAALLQKGWLDGVDVAKEEGKWSNAVVAPVQERWPHPFNSPHSELNSGSPSPPHPPTPSWPSTLASCVGRLQDQLRLHRRGSVQHCGLHRYLCGQALRTHRRDRCPLRCHGEALGAEGLGSEGAVRVPDIGEDGQDRCALRHHGAALGGAGGRGGFDKGGEEGVSWLGRCRA